MRKTFAELSKQELQTNPNSFVLLGDISVGNFLDANDNLPDRVFNMGIAEQAMVGFAAGLSTANGNVIVHTIAAFLIERAFEQIKLCCGYNKNKLILISANGPYDYDKLGPTHHCPNDVTLLMTIPGMNIRIPATVEDMRECYQEALAYNDSTYIRCTSRAAKLDVEPVRIDYVWRKLPGRNGTRAVVCIGESLTYALQTYKDTPIYWTVAPRSALPMELDQFEEIVILEPYTNNFIQIPESFHCKSITRRHFSIEHKKIMQKNLGWEDFQE
jgi:transketolase